MKEHTSQGLSRRLWDAGFRGEHTHVYDKEGQLWIIQNRDDKHNALAVMPYPYRGTWLICTEPNCPDHDGEAIPAYTFSEILGFFRAKGIDIAIEWIDGTMTACRKDENNNHDPASVIEHEIPVECLGLLMEWLIDNGHITLFTMEGTPHEQ